MKYYLSFIFIILFSSGCALKVNEVPNQPRPQLLPPVVIKPEPVINIEKMKEKSKNNIKKTIVFFKNLDENSTNCSNKSKFQKISNLNDFFNNNFEYKTDPLNYNKEDYWASFYEMIQSGFCGDCEDFTFGKIQLAEEFGIPKEDIFVGFTESGKHIFPIFFDGTNYVISDTKGKIRTFMSYVEKYDDLKVYSYADIWKTKDNIFSLRRGNNVILKVTGENIKSN